MKGALTDPNPTSRIPNPDNQLLEIIATTLHGFVRNTNEALWESVDELQDMSRLVAEKRMTKKYFEMTQKACGITFNPHGLLADKTLRDLFKPLDMHTEDWSHVYLCHGVGGDELAHLMRRLKRCGVGTTHFGKRLSFGSSPEDTMVQ